MTVLVNRVLPARPVDSLADYEAAGGGEALIAARKVGSESVIAELERSGLRGRGGAGFPTGSKWRAVYDNRSEVVASAVVVNAAEGEPGTWKDRAIMRANPYHVLEGALIAATVIDASEVIVALKESFDDEIARMSSAIDEIAAAGWSRGFDVKVHRGPNEYLYGEETALLESIDGRPPFPRIAPPYRRGVVEVVDGDETPIESGLAAQIETSDADLAPPALVDNVETLANIPAIVIRGAAWFRTLGTERSPGTIVCTISGAVASPGVGEVPMGTPLNEAITAIAGGERKGRQIVAVLPGASAAPLPSSMLSVPLTYEAMAEAGSGLGSAGYIVVDDESDVVAVVAGVSRFLAVESCGQCTPCKQDALVLSDTLTRLVRNEGTANDVEVLRDRVSTVADGARCSIGRQHEALVGGLLDRFGDAVAAHIEQRAEPAEPLVVGEEGKQPDWSFDEEWSGETPVDVRTDHRATATRH